MLKSDTIPLEEISEEIERAWKFMPYKIPYEGSSINRFGSQIDFECLNCNTIHHTTFNAMELMWKEKGYYCNKCFGDFDPVYNHKSPAGMIETDPALKFDLDSEFMIMEGIRDKLGIQPYEFISLNKGENVRLRHLACSTIFTATPTVLYDQFTTTDRYLGGNLTMPYCPKCNHIMERDGINFAGARFIERLHNHFETMELEMPYEFREDDYYRFTDYNAKLIVTCKHCQNRFSETPSELFTLKGNSLCPICHGKPKSENTAERSVEDIEAKNKIVSKPVIAEEVDNSQQTNLEEKFVEPIDKHISSLDENKTSGFEYDDGIDEYMEEKDDTIVVENSDKSSIGETYPEEYKSNEIERERYDRQNSDEIEKENVSVSTTNDDQVKNAVEVINTLHTTESISDKETIYESIHMNHIDKECVDENIDNNSKDQIASSEENDIDIRKESSISSRVSAGDNEFRSNQPEEYLEKDNSFEINTIQVETSDIDYTQTIPDRREGNDDSESCAQLHTIIERDNSIINNLTPNTPIDELTFESLPQRDTSNDQDYYSDEDDYLECIETNVEALADQQELLSEESNYTGESVDMGSLNHGGYSNVYEPKNIPMGEIDFSNPPIADTEEAKELNEREVLPIEESEEELSQSIQEIFVDMVNEDRESKTIEVDAQNQVVIENEDDYEDTDDDNMGIPDDDEYENDVEDSNPIDETTSFDNRIPPSFESYVMRHAFDFPENHTQELDNQQQSQVDLDIDSFISQKQDQINIINVVNHDNDPVLDVDDFSFSDLDDLM